MKIKTLAQQLLFSTVPIETRDFEENLLGTGTSFILSHNFPGHGSELFMVTNKYVIEGAWVGYSYFTTMENGEPVIGKPFSIKSDPAYSSGWHGHPDPEVDIAVRPISWELDLIEKDDTKAFYMGLSTDIIPTPDEIEKSDAILSVVFVGYPNGLFDKKNYTQIIRKGTTATPVQLDYDGRPTFLIDASVFPGSSGSPVFSYELTWDGGISDLKLLGIIAEVFCRTEVGEIQSLPAPTSTSFAFISQMIELGVVFKSSLVLETLDSFWQKHKDGLIEYKRFQQTHPPDQTRR